MMRSGPRRCLGVDGAKAGWIAVWRAGTGLAHRVYPGAQALLDAHGDAGVIAVDIPIGLPAHGRRAADAEARRFVGGRRASSIFSTPVRGVLHAAVTLWVAERIAAGQANTLPAPPECDATGLPMAIWY